MIAEKKLDSLRLSSPFTKGEIEWRIQRSGVRDATDPKTGKSGKKPWAVIVPYVTARAIQERLDHVIGPENWMCHFEKVDGGFLCTLGIKVNSEWVTKQDGAETTDIEPFKGGISGAFKRAAVMWGIGRDLYETKTTWAEFGDRNDHPHTIKIDNQTYYWKAPA